jgi:hypothetical protein
VIRPVHGQCRPPLACLHENPRGGATGPCASSAPNTSHAQPDGRSDGRATRHMDRFAVSEGAEVVVDSTCLYGQTSAERVGRSRRAALETGTSMLSPRRLAGAIQAWPTSRPDHRASRGPGAPTPGILPVAERPSSTAPCVGRWKRALRPTPLFRHGPRPPRRHPGPGAVVCHRGPVTLSDPRSSGLARLPEDGLTVLLLINAV